MCCPKVFLNWMHGRANDSQPVPWIVSVHQLVLARLLVKFCSIVSLLFCVFMLKMDALVKQRDLYRVLAQSQSPSVSWGQQQLCYVCICPHMSVLANLVCQGKGRWGLHAQPGILLGKIGERIMAMILMLVGCSYKLQHMYMFAMWIEGNDWQSELGLEKERCVQLRTATVFLFWIVCWALVVGVSFS